MKTEELKALGLTDEQIGAVMAANGKALAGAQEKARQLEAERDALKGQLSEAAGQIDGFKGLDVDWKTKYEQAEADSKAQLDAMRLDAAAREYVSGIRFTSDLARDAFTAQFKAAGLKYAEGTGFMGAGDFTKSMKEKNPSAFEPEKASGAGFFDKTPGVAGDSPSSAMNSILRGGLNDG